MLIKMAIAIYGKVEFVAIPRSIFTQQTISGASEINFVNRTLKHQRHRLGRPIRQSQIKSTARRTRAEFDAECPFTSNQRNWTEGGSLSENTAILSTTRRRNKDRVPDWVSYLKNILKPGWAHVLRTLINQRCSIAQLIRCFQWQTNEELERKR